MFETTQAKRPPELDDCNEAQQQRPQPRRETISSPQYWQWLAVRCGVHKRVGVTCPEVYTQIFRICYASRRADLQSQPSFL
jgi:hypothetical protein